MHNDIRTTMVDFMQMKSFAEDPLVLTAGEGIRVIDVAGHRYIDGLSGTFCARLGHGNAILAYAGAAQLRRLAMAAPTMATNDRALELIDRLLGLLPDRYAVVKLLSGGSEATESAMKIARQHHEQAGHPLAATALLRASHSMLVHAPPLTITAPEVDGILGISGAALDDVVAAGAVPGFGPAASTAR